MLVIHKKNTVAEHNSLIGHIIRIWVYIFHNKHQQCLRTVDGRLNDVVPTIRKSVQHFENFVDRIVHSNVTFFLLVLIVVRCPGRHQRSVLLLPKNTPFLTFFWGSVKIRIENCRHIDPDCITFKTLLQEQSTKICSKIFLFYHFGIWF
jgi:hypothetical protein